MNSERDCCVTFWGENVNLNIRGHVNGRYAYDTLHPQLRSHIESGRIVLLLVSSIATAQLSVAFHQSKHHIMRHWPTFSPTHCGSQTSQGDCSRKICQSCAMHSKGVVDAGQKCVGDDWLCMVKRRQACEVQTTIRPMCAGGRVGLGEGGRIVNCLGGTVSG
jgi:hypothetical protein